MIQIALGFFKKRRNFPVKQLHSVAQHCSGTPIITLLVIFSACNIQPDCASLTIRSKKNLAS